MSIENPQNVEELITHCKMRIGEPLIRVNVTDMQARIRVKEAMYLFLSYHFDATEDAWLKQEITPAIQANKEFEVPDFVVGVSKILNPKPNIFKDINMLGSSIYSVLNRNILMGVETMSKVDVYLYEREISEWEQIWRPTPGYGFNRTTKTLKIDTSAIHLIVGEYVMYRAKVDVSKFTGDFFSNDWLIRYTSTLIKEQWADNLSKIKDITLPGGHRIDVDGIASSAAREKESLRQELYDNAMDFSPVSIG
ncbi:neck protein [Rhizobium phage RHph_I46]|uniref:Neck protein n=1 Tax=Rhizobium phage RHph_I1_9 TaxID=2509729 RepID=A0A7S5RJ90_9CAUD|nr:head-tail adaptor Ad2 [Rhizobium phage RHph_I1_9]QIG69586.1 neck protein [Rhizobium phage RHph_I46]QIG70867.1 neck protein [Rhizobium phage RHph_I9]QIG73454.1 neck protein [Rhizobium phage RHph_I1_9]QIG76206.1 neck protein [Rhizobium phage RHph_I34]